MFRPNASCLVYRRNQDPDVYGRYTFAAPVATPCAVVDMAVLIKRTAIRPEVSASRGRAEEEAGIAMLLFPADTKLQEGDIVLVNNQALEASSFFLRANVLGQFDHLQVEFRKGAVPQ